MFVNRFSDAERTLPGSTKSVGKAIRAMVVTLLFAMLRIIFATFIIDKESLIAYLLLFVKAFL